MGLNNSAAAVIVAAALCAPAIASAQEPVASFSQVGDRLKLGDTVWVTDAQGREIKGEIGALEPGAIAVRGRRGETFNGSDVRQVTVRRGDSLANGATIGMAIGALAGLGAGIAACAAYPKDDPLRGDACLMAIGLLWMPGMGAGALVGVGIDAMIPSKQLVVVYRAPGARDGASARVSVGPVITPRAKGAAVAFSF
jgi:hypothetical protein